ncbi:hypothetical protein [Vulcanisaeta souniana]|uniref:Peptidase M48 domain-containing protein n=2 Tax=Vulcanisaeta souniana TaxID=164452 RepID=A0A830E3K8_9CREN|nr:hypothetical protein [Vulcanisaeta souniana]BDR92158.1 hypothetical protein Vsou_12510 [Vulcanisaeta souniana JCM 11219]GGI67515.1 hypothetical protein GCM10007112_00580 [Vulcanisaeta souniana JCM 11219]
MKGKPDWVGKYEDIINELRLALYDFEMGIIDFQSFINRINKSLINHDYDPVKVIRSDTMTELFGAYAVYVPHRLTSIIYVSTELMNGPRTFLGRVLMHEVFHHVLYQRPPSLLFKLAPKRGEPLFLIISPLIFLIALAIPFNNVLLDFLPHILIGVSATMALTIAVLIKALSRHELVATALVIYLITGRWVTDWVYYHDENALMNLKWRDEVRPREIIVMQR